MLRRFLLPLLLVLTALSALLANAAGVSVTSAGLTTFSGASSIAAATCTATVAADSYADQALLLSNYGSATELQVTSLALAAKRSFVRFDLSGCSIPATARVKTATMTLRLTSAPSSSRSYDVHALTATWQESTVSWSSQPAAAVTATASFATGTTSGFAIAIDVAADVQRYVAGTATNYGWGVKDGNEAALVAVNGRFGARENSMAGNRPALVVTYYP